MHYSTSDLELQNKRLLNPEINHITWPYSVFIRFMCCFKVKNLRSKGQMRSFAVILLFFSLYLLYCVLTIVDYFN